VLVIGSRLAAVSCPLVCRRRKARAPHGAECPPLRSSRGLALDRRMAATVPRFAPRPCPSRSGLLDGYFRPIVFVPVPPTTQLSHHGPFLELFWAEITEMTMTALAFAISPDVIDHIRSRFVSSALASSVQALAFEWTNGRSWCREL
jgi:hypothetical protein